MFFEGVGHHLFFGLNLNASKSGLSLSQTNLLRTYNFSNPNRSSANILGIEIRGKKATPWALLDFWISLPIHLIKLLIGLITIGIKITDILVIEPLASLYNLALIDRHAMHVNTGFMDTEQISLIPTWSD